LGVALGKLLGSIELNNKIKGAIMSIEGNDQQQNYSIFSRAQDLNSIL
jgi:hypothetical protein